MWQHNAPLPGVLIYWQLSWSALPLFIKICFVIATIAVGGIIAAIIGITVRRKRMFAAEGKLVKLRSLINAMLLSVSELVPGIGENPLSRANFDSRQFFRLGLPAKKVRQTIVQEILNFRTYFSGQVSEQVRKLYVGLGLHKIAFKKLRDNNWENKATALSELFRMDVRVPEPTLLELVKDKNRFTREYARLSLMKFATGDPLRILHEQNEHISLWEELEIFLLLQKRTDVTADSVGELISLQKDPSLASLALKLAVNFRMFDLSDKIIALLETPQLKLRLEAVSAIGKLGTVRGERHLYSIYEEQPHEIRLAIIEALGNIDSDDYLPFLENEFLTSSDFETKKYVSDAIIKLYPLSGDSIKRLMLNSDELEQVILTHSQDPLINAS